MKLLLDTQVLFWWYSEPLRVSKRAISLMEDSENDVLVSAAVAWELAIKSAIGKLDALSLTLDLSRLLAEDGFSELPIGISQATRAGLLPLHHRDPFDRLIVAQAQDLNIPILSSDRLLDLYDVNRLW
ncbi:MAG TPA: type II toxin-antitoxin system VapC family toxin [Terriglobales bacterium]|nr:type II toxin-antitoxin system VapC family toxin [Terriglobales bacterium]